MGQGRRLLVLSLLAALLASLCTAGGSGDKHSSLGHSRKPCFTDILLHRCQHCHLPHIHKKRDCPRRGYDCSRASKEDFDVSRGKKGKDCDELKCKDAEAKLFVEGRPEPSLACWKKTWKYKKGSCYDGCARSALCAKSCVGVCNAALPPLERRASPVKLVPACDAKEPCDTAICDDEKTLAGYLLGGTGEAVIITTPIQCGGDKLWHDQQGNSYTDIFCKWKQNAPPAPPGCPAAPPGRPGPPGAAGPIGPPGDKGDPGTPGTSGPPGVGPAGPKGSKGEKGVKGELGDKGDPGFKGYRGPKGNQGDKGNRGYPGWKGDRGDKGDKGQKGEVGPQGDKGQQGVKGEPGIKGATGDKGDRGPVGLTCPTLTSIGEAFPCTVGSTARFCSPLPYGNTITSVTCQNGGKLASRIISKTTNFVDGATPARSTATCTALTQQWDYPQFNPQMEFVCYTTSQTCTFTNLPCPASFYCNQLVRYASNRLDCPSPVYTLFLSPQTPATSNQLQCSSSGNTAWTNAALSNPRHVGAFCGISCGTTCSQNVPNTKNTAIFATIDGCLRATCPPGQRLRGCNSGSGNCAGGSSDDATLLAAVCTTTSNQWLIGEGSTASGMKVRVFCE